MAKHVISLSILLLGLILADCATKKSRSLSGTGDSDSPLTCANGLTSASIFTQQSSGVAHNHTGTACLHCHDVNAPLDINENIVSATRAPGFTLAGTIYASNEAIGSLPSSAAPPIAAGETILFKDFTNTTQVASAITDCAGNFWVKAANDTRNISQYYSGGAGATATATINPATGGVFAFTVMAGGTCQGTPAVTTAGGGCGSQPTGTAIMSGTSVAALAVKTSGSGCTSAPPTVNFTLACGVTPVATATLSGGKIVSTNVTTGGTCTNGSTPSVSITGLTGCTIQPVLQPIMLGTTVSQLVVIDQGAGCGGVPAVNFAATCSLAPTATASFRAGEVTSVSLSGGGSGYTTGQVFIKLLGGGSSATGAGAAFAGTVTGGVLSGAINVVASGTGYTSAPSVLITGRSNADKKAAAYYTATIQSTNRTMTLRTEQGDCNSGNCHTNAAASSGTGIRGTVIYDPTANGTNALGTYDPTSGACPGTGCYPLTPTAPYATLGNYAGLSPTTPIIPLRYMGKIFK